MSRTKPRSIEAEEARYRWITTTQAAERIGGAAPVTTEHVVALCDAGELTWRDVSSPGAKRREIRVEPGSVDAFLASRTRQAA